MALPYVAADVCFPSQRTQATLHFVREPDKCNYFRSVLSPKETCLWDKTSHESFIMRSFQAPLQHEPPRDGLNAGRPA